MLKYAALMIVAILSFFFFSSWFIQEVWLTNFRPQRPDLTTTLSALSFAALASIVVAVWSLVKAVKLSRACTPPEDDGA